MIEHKTEEGHVIADGDRFSMYTDAPMLSIRDLKGFELPGRTRGGMPLSTVAGSAIVNDVGPDDPLPEEWRFHPTEIVLTEQQCGYL